MSRFAGRCRAALFAATVLVLGVYGSTASAQTAPDFSTPGSAFNVLPPGNAGGIPVGVNSSDQIPLYDGLTPKFDNVTAADLPNFYKANVFGLGGLPVQRTQTFPNRPGLVVRRDTYNVPHVEASSRDDVMYGIGYVTAEDRTLLMDTLRGPGRIAAVDAPGLNPFALAQQLQPFVPTQQTEDYLAKQIDLVLSMPGGQRIADDVDHYLLGINDFRTQAGNTGRPWNRNDVVAVAALIGAVFGDGGGDEARRAQLLSALQDRLGKRKGNDVWNDLREQLDPETSVSVDGRFPLTSSRPDRDGNAVIDADSLDTTAARASVAAQASDRAASNAVLIGAKRSATGNPFFVAGPQVGYFYPQVLYEVDAHGGGIDARGVTFPGAGPYVQLGRGQDFSWSATSAGNDNVDTFVEELCGDDTHYRFKGKCLEMTTFNAGKVGFGAGTDVTFKETVHGPVLGYATVDGERVALSTARSTRGREVVSAFGFADLNANVPTGPRSFFKTVSQIEFTFNWFYADEDNIAMYSSGRIPVRHRDVDLGLPTIGTGKYEWRGFLSASKHPHGTTPRDGTIVNWNNKPAAGWQAADDQWSYGSVHRNELLEDATERQRKHTLASTVAAMNRAATQDLRVAQVFSAIKAVLRTGPAPNARTQRMYELLVDWREQGSSRLDRDLNGTIDHPGAAIMDKAWTKIADAVMTPVLGPQLDDLASLNGRDNRPSNQGSAYGGGWYGYVDKDLRSLLARRDDDDRHKGKSRRHERRDDDDDGRHERKWRGHEHSDVDGRFKTKFCGAGDLTACRSSLWAALDQAGIELATEQGTPTPDAWRADATAERIRFVPGILPTTMRWTNRPTFQQAISYWDDR